jgi:imidazolonepropionase-like amidohydrolase
VSKDAGHFIRWSGDASKLHWSMGPELFTRDLADSFAFLEGAPEELPDPPASGVNIGFSMKSDLPRGKLALVGGTIVTMKGDEVIKDGVVLIEGNRIVAVGPKGTVEVPGDAKTIDVSGKTVLPGLVDVHAHGPQGNSGLLPEANWLNHSSLSFGVTTIHDPSNDTYEIFAASEMGRAGLSTGPRIFSTGTILYGAKGDFKAEINSLDDARMHLVRMKAIGAFSVKSYNQPRRDQRQQVTTAAAELGMMVVPEGGSLFQHNMTMVVDGHTGIEHAIPVASVYDDVLQLWGATQVGYTPTLGVAYGGVWGENYWYQHTDVWNHDRLLSFVPRERVDPRARRRMHVSEGDWNHIRSATTAKHLTDAGVKVNLGAHGQREGLAAHWELWMMVQGGMTPHEALRSGTLNGAFYLGLDGDIRSLEVGKLADLMVVDGDPLEDIRESEKVSHVMVNGRLFDASTMAQEGNDPKPAPRMYWKIDESMRASPAQGTTRSP